MQEAEDGGARSEECVAWLVPYSLYYSSTYRNCRGAAGCEISIGMVLTSEIYIESLILLYNK